MPDIYETIIMVSISAVGGLVGLVLYFLKRDLKRFDRTFEIIKDNIRAIASCLFKAEGVDFDPSYMKDYSPLRITPEGLKYLEKVGFIQVLEDHPDEFLRVIDVDNPKVKYDVEQSAIKTVFALLDEDYFRPVKVYFYNNPKENIRSFAKLAGVYLRDRYLEKHTEITQ